MRATINPNIYDGLDYTTKEINSTFKIWAYGYNHNGIKIDTLIGVSGLIQLIGIDLTNTLVGRAFNETINSDKAICKLRRGLKITFYNY